MIRRLSYMILLMSIVIMFFGCNKLLETESSPHIRSITWTLSCGGEETITPVLYWGATVTKLYAEFDTYNVNQYFDAYVLVDSPLVPAELHPRINYSKFTTVHTDSGKGSGIKRVAFDITTRCQSTGGYEMTIVITDANDKNDTRIDSFTLEESPMFGSDPCGCVSQCGPCTLQFYTIVERCHCNCPLYYEQCK